MDAAVRPLPTAVAPHRVGREPARQTVKLCTISLLYFVARLT